MVTHFVDLGEDRTACGITFPRNSPVTPSLEFTSLFSGVSCKSCIKRLNIKTPDMVNHPPHYTTGDTEVWDYIRQQGLDYFLGNAVKYLSRAGKKNPDKYLEDLEKAEAYIAKAKKNYIEEKGE